MSGGGTAAMHGQAAARPSVLSARRVGLLSTLAVCVLVALTMVVVLLQGGGSHARLPGGTVGGAATYTTRAAWGYRLRFAYPGEWQHHEWHQISTSSTSILTYVSTGAQHDPCHVTASGYRCAMPLDSLQPDGVLATWSAWSLPERTPGPAESAARSASGLFVWITTRPATRLGADERVTARIARSPGSPIWWQLDALVRGPGLLRNQAAIREMVSSARLIPSR